MSYEQKIMDSLNNHTEKVKQSVLKEVLDETRKIMRRNIPDYMKLGLIEQYLESIIISDPDDNDDDVPKPIPRSN